MRRIIVLTVSLAVVGTTLAGCLPGADAEVPAPAGDPVAPAAPAHPSGRVDPARPKDPNAVNDQTPDGEVK